MLKHLTIKNYALIKHLELQPSSHLNVITGETGAGKSIMLGAIGLLMGNRADTKVLWNEDEKCIIEGSFDIRDYKLKPVFKSEDLDYEDVSVIRREISPGGKSRAFINDTPVTLEVMRRIGTLLMDIHSQHETLELGNQNFQLNLIDAFAGNASIREDYAEAWTSYTKAKRDYDKLTKEAASLREESDYIKFQLEELVKANLNENEQESLESELKMMEHSEEIKNRFNTALQLLSLSEYNVQSALSDVKNELQHLAGFSNTYEALYQRLESSRIELEDIISEIEKEESNIDFDAERIEFVKERLSNIYRLEKKHRVNSVKELITIQESLQEKADLTSNLDEELENSRKAFKESFEKVQSIASKLSESRKKTFNPLTKQITRLLHELGMPNASLAIDIKHIEPTPSGIDQIDILFSANKGIAPRSLVQVASGGEFSRLMFSVKYVMAEKTAMPTLILDEIDNGISGEIAIKLGALMQEMSRQHQLITITHLPQIAAKGDAHFYVFKDNTEKKTVSSIKKLGETERVEEIAKMIGGANPSKIALENAQELLAK
ncbi:DNA repair protein RecN [Chryseosolibacter indicus]|uniref:DNA repair protein RecN n=1 Tax=Chryseosolibacter indicus TaxID=2782351 RepID=A0ABS5VL73_9BACT|nr:DNA repair protein RecN [Chryseosolibacter indicus]MBT1702189.1 DNA repair protein RecN [Chryseosolibacter indicus]